MASGLKALFLIHCVVAILIGAPLLIAPGQFLGASGWAPIDPLLSRVLGAALLGLAWGSFRGWRATDRSQVTVLLELEAIFAILASVGLLRHLLVANWPLMVWGTFAVFAAFAVAWTLALVRR